MRKTLKKRDIFILRRYLGTTRGHDGTQMFFKRKFDTSALKWRVARIFWIARTEIISKNKRTPNKVTGLYTFDGAVKTSWTQALLWRNTGPLPRRCAVSLCLLRIVKKNAASSSKDRGFWWDPRAWSVPKIKLNTTNVDACAVK